MYGGAPKGALDPADKNVRTRGKIQGLCLLSFTYHDM